jgi:cation:H+ antiporter
MTIFTAVLIFIGSLALLMKASDWLLYSAERIGIRYGMSPFLVGITITAFGTSFPELVSSSIAVYQGFPDVATGNAVGSNVANILLVLGVAAVVGKRLEVSKNLIDLDLPLLAISTGLFYLVVKDGSVNVVESIILLVAYVIYLVYAIKFEKTIDDSDVKRPRLKKKDILYLLLGVGGLAVGANYLIDSVTFVSTYFNIATGLVAITAIALGTSLPELLVSVKAALAGKAEVALGNIFGSNIFNILVVVGLPGLFVTLPLSEKTLSVGVPVMLLSTGLFVISGISRRLHPQEGWLFLTMYVVFIAKLFDLF